MPPPKVQVQRESVHVGAVRAGATARVAKQPSPIVVNGPSVNRCDSLEQRSEEKFGLIKGRKSAQLPVSSRSMDSRGASLSSGSPGLGELSGWAVLEQWVAEDGGSSGKEATAVQGAKTITCQVKTGPSNKGLNADAACFVPGVRYAMPSKMEWEATQLLSPGVLEGVAVNEAQGEMESECQGVASEVNSHGGPGSAGGSRPVANWCFKKPGGRQCQRAQEVLVCGATKPKQINVGRSVALY